MVFALIFYSAAALNYQDVELLDSVAIALQEMKEIVRGIDVAYFATGISLLPGGHKYAELLRELSEQIFLNEL